MISFGAGIAERWLAVNVSELEIAVFLVMVKGTTGKLTVGQTVVVASTGRMPAPLWKKLHKTKWSTTPRDEHNKPGEWTHDLWNLQTNRSPAEEGNSNLQAIQARLYNSFRMECRGIRILRVKKRTQIKPINHTKRWTQQTRRMNNMSRTYRYNQENYTPKNRQKRSGKNKLAWNTFREQSRDVLEMSKIEGFDGNRTKWKF